MTRFHKVADVQQEGDDRRKTLIYKEQEVASSMKSMARQLEQISPDDRESLRRLYDSLYGLLNYIQRNLQTAWLDPYLVSMVPGGVEQAKEFGLLQQRIVENAISIVDAGQLGEAAKQLESGADEILAASPRLRQPSGPTPPKVERMKVRNQYKDAWGKAHLMRLQGARYKDIAQYLEDEDIPTLRGGMWYSQVVKKLLERKPTHQELGSYVQQLHENNFDTYQIADILSNMKDLGGWWGPVEVERLLSGEVYEGTFEQAEKARKEKDELKKRRKEEAKKARERGIELYNEGYTSKEIASRLFEEGFTPAHGGEWTRQTVNNWIRELKQRKQKAARFEYSIKVVFAAS